MLQVCTVNLDFLVNARADREVGTVLRNSGLNVPDGMPVVWLSRMRGGHVPARVAGADLVVEVIDLAASTGARVFLLGGDGGVSEEAAAALIARYPTLQIAGCLEPPRDVVDDLDDDSIVRFVNQSRTDVLLVAFGHPRQDKWLYRNRDRLDVSVGIGVGCCFDLIAGRRRRAPRVMQRHGCEWLYRMAVEPRRLSGRYLTDAAWLPVLASLVLSKRLSRRRPDAA